MLFQLLCDTIYSVITGMLFWLEIPQTDVFTELLSVVDLAVTNGVGILKFFVPETFMLFGLVYVVACEGGKMLWGLVMFILRKIPMIGIN